MKVFVATFFLLPGLAVAQTFTESFDAELVVTSVSGPSDAEPLEGTFVNGEGQTSSYTLFCRNVSDGAVGDREVVAAVLTANSVESVLELAGEDGETEPFGGTTRILTFDSNGAADTVVVNFSFAETSDNPAEENFTSTETLTLTGRFFNKAQPSFTGTLQSDRTTTFTPLNRTANCSESIRISGGLGPFAEMVEPQESTYLDEVREFIQSNPTIRDFLFDETRSQNVESTNAGGVRG